MSIRAVALISLAVLNKPTIIIPAELYQSFPPTTHEAQQSLSLALGNRRMCRPSVTVVLQNLLSLPGDLCLCATRTPQPSTKKASRYSIWWCLGPHDPAQGKQQQQTKKKKKKKKKKKHGQCKIVYGIRHIWHMRSEPSTGDVSWNSIQVSPN
jgi:hypothetical protein